MKAEIKKYISWQFLRYCIVGGINTLVGFGFVFMLMAFGLIAEIANFLGYCIGIVVSFLLNSHFTFKVSRNNVFWRFCVAMGISYLLNLLTLMICYRMLLFDVYVAQILSGVIYTLSGFLLSKFFVFKER